MESINVKENTYKSDSHGFITNFSSWKYKNFFKKIYPIFKIPHVNLLLENIFEELFPLFYLASYKEVCYVFKYASWKKSVFGITIAWLHDNWP